MKKLKDDIKNNKFEKVYLIFGEEDYLRKAFRNSLKDAIIGTENTMNYNYFQGKNIDFENIEGISETLPFFGERRLIVIEDSGYFKNSNEKVVEYIERIPESTYFVFVEKEVDKRGKLYKQVKNRGYECEMTKQSEFELSAWANKIFLKDGKSISKDTLLYLINCVGYDMENLTKEIEKVICYCMDRNSITRKDIDEICVSEITGKIFEMIDAMSNKNPERLLNLYYDLIELKEPPMRILFMIVRQFKIMLQIQELKSKGYGESSIAQTLGMRNFIVSKAFKQLENFRDRKITGILNSCAEIEEQVKTGRVDELIGVELLLISFSR